MKLAAILTKNAAHSCIYIIHERQKGQKSIYQISKRLTLSCLTQTLKHLGSCETRDWMVPTAVEFLHGQQEKNSVRQVRMRHLQRGGIDNKVINRHDVDVHQAVDVTALAVTMGQTAQAALDIMDVIEHLLGGHRAAQADAHIQETVLTLKSPGLALDDRRDGTASRACR